MNGEWVSVTELSKVLNVTRRAIQLSIKRGKYPTARRVNNGKVGQGGKVWQIHIEDPGIPPEVRSQYYGDLPQAERDKALADHPEPPATVGFSETHIDFLSGQGQGTSKPVPGCPSMEMEQNTSTDRSPVADRDGALIPTKTTSLSLQQTQEFLLLSGQGQGLSHSPAPAFSEKAKKIALARMDLLRAWKEYRKNHQRLMTADSEFESAYNDGLIQRNLNDILGNVSVKTLYKWDKELDGTSDWTRLVPLNLCKIKEGAQLSADEQKAFLNIILNPRKFRIGTAVQLTKAYLKNKGIPSHKSSKTFYRFANKFKSENYDLWIFLREGQKALKDKVEPFIKRDPSLLQVGDVLVVDGHRLNFQTINPFTGKSCRAVLIGYLDWKSYDLAGYEIMVEENTQCIASALRSSIIRLGTFPKITYQDNGKAFRSRFFTSTESFEEIGMYGLFGRLGIVPVFAQPYNARSKIIERWFGDFSDTCERSMSSFIGASISDKPAWMLRNEKFHKARHGEYIPTIEETKQIIDSWLTWHRSKPCPHVKDKTIGQVFEEGRGPGVDVNKLDDLMMAMRITKIGRNGIRFLNADYYDDNLYGLRENVVIKYSLFDLSYIKVYDLKGQYLCAAKRVIDVHPMANYLGDAKDVETLKQGLAQQKRAKRKTMQGAKELIKLGKPLALDWEGIIDASPRIVDRFEKENITLPEIADHIPNETAKDFIATDTHMTQEDQECIVETTEPIFDWQWQRYDYLLIKQKKQSLTDGEKQWIKRYKESWEYEEIYINLRQQGVPLDNQCLHQREAI